MSARDVVHHKTLFADDLRSQNFMILMDGFISSERDHNDLEGVVVKAFKPGDTGATEVERLQRVLRMSESYYVAPNMVQLAIAASEQMPDEPLLATDLPSWAGFMWFAQPFRMLDIRRKSLSVNAVMWTTFGGRVRLWHFTHRSDPFDSVNQHLKATFSEKQLRDSPYLNLNHAFELEFGKHLPRGLSWDKPLPWDAKVDVHTVRDPETGELNTVIATDASWADYLGPEPPRSIRSPLAAFIVTIWRLCQQTITTIERPPLGRADLRRLRRANLPETPITVITLRKKGHQGHGDSHIEWTHQWIVRGHWRNQWYPSEKTHRYIYINPFLKGPENAPLLVREHVNSLVR